jgi:V-type H+-transporting ATPase subunit E
MLNAARLRVLKAREDHVSTVLEEAKKRLVEETKDTAKYTGLLQQLIAQGLLQV